MFITLCIYRYCQLASQTNPRSVFLGLRPPLKPQRRNQFEHTHTHQLKVQWTNGHTLFNYASIDVNLHDYWFWTDVCMIAVGSSGPYTSEFGCITSTYHVGNGCCCCCSQCRTPAALTSFYRAAIQLVRAVCDVIE